MVKERRILITDSNCETSKVVDFDTRLSPRMKDYSGEIIEGKWKILKPSGKNIKGRMLWEAECLRCGNKIIGLPYNLGQSRCECESKKVVAGKFKIYSGVSFYDWCIANHRNDLLDCWDYEKNDLLPTESGIGSEIPIWFTCPKHIPDHLSRTYRVCNFTSGVQKGVDCKRCHSIGEWMIENLGENSLDRFWDYEKNEIDPFVVSFRSNKKVY